MKAFADQW